MAQIPSTPASEALSESLSHVPSTCPDRDALLVTVNHVPAPEPVLPSVRLSLRVAVRAATSGPSPSEPPPSGRASRARIRPDGGRRRAACTKTACSLRNGRAEQQTIDVVSLKPRINHLLSEHLHDDRVEQPAPPARPPPTPTTCRTRALLPSHRRERQTVSRPSRVESRSILSGPACFPTPIARAGSDPNISAWARTQAPARCCPRNGTASLQRACAPDILDSSIELSLGALVLLRPAGDQGSGAAAKAKADTSAAGNI